MIRPIEGILDLLLKEQSLRLIVLRQINRLRRNSHDTGQLIVVPLRIENCRINAILDTGSEINMVNQKELQGLSEVIINPDHQIVMKDANSGTGVLQGQIPHLVLKCGHLQTSGTFFVGPEDLPFNMLLGRPWQRNNLVSIDEWPEGTYLIFKDSTTKVKYELMVNHFQPQPNYLFDIRGPSHVTFFANVDREQASTCHSTCTTEYKCGCTHDTSRIVQSEQANNSGDLAMLSSMTNNELRDLRQLHSSNINIMYDKHNPCSGLRSTLFLQNDLRRPEQYMPGLESSSVSEIYNQSGSLYNQLLSQNSGHIDVTHESIQGSIALPSQEYMVEVQDQEMRDLWGMEPAIYTPIHPTISQALHGESTVSGHMPNVYNNGHRAQTTESTPMELEKTTRGSAGKLLISNNSLPDMSNNEIQDWILNTVEEWLDECLPTNNNKKSNCIKTDTSKSSPKPKGRASRGRKPKQDTQKSEILSHACHTASKSKRKPPQPLKLDTDMHNSQERWEVGPDNTLNLLDTSHRVPRGLEGVKNGKTPSHPQERTEFTSQAVRNYPAMEKLGKPVRTDPYHSPDLPDTFPSLPIGFLEAKKGKTSPHLQEMAECTPQSLMTHPDMGKLK